MDRSESGTPGRVRRNGEVTFEGIVLAGADTVLDLHTRDGIIVAVSRSTNSARWLCTPPLADLHVHANRAFTSPWKRPRGLEDAVRSVGEVFDAFGAVDYERHAKLLFDAAYRHATTKLRTHADIGSDTRLAAVEGSLAAAESCRERMEVDVVAFAAASADPATATGMSLMREALDAGAHFIGAAPAFCPDQHATIDAVLDLAAERDVPADLHLDEHLEPDRSCTGYLAAATIERGLEDRVTVGHACALSGLPEVDRRRVIDALARARITVISLPRTNLYLQDALGTLPIRRGVTPVRELIAAGVPVRLASDNVRDAFYPFGDADLIGVAMDGILASHVDDPEQLVAAICDGRTAFEEGDSADFVLFPGTDFDALFADTPAERWVVTGGVAKKV